MWLSKKQGVLSNQQVLFKNQQPHFVDVGALQKSMLPSVSVPILPAVAKQLIIGQGVAAQPGDGTQQPSAFVTTQEQRMDVARKQQPVDVAQKQPVGMPVASQSVDEDKQPRLQLQSELAQPVPLDVLINHNLIIPLDQLTITLLVPTKMNLFIGPASLWLHAKSQQPIIRPFSCFLANCT